jgi:hypothetical protein
VITNAPAIQKPVRGVWNGSANQIRRHDLGDDPAKLVVMPFALDTGPSMKNGIVVPRQQ